MIEFTKYEFLSILAPILLGCLALGSLVLDMTFWRGKPKLIGIFTFIGLVVIMFAQLAAQIHFLNGAVYSQKITFGGQISLDLFGSVFIYIFMGAALFAVISAFTHFNESDNHRGEYYILLTIATLGMCLMALSNNLLLLFIGLETMSIPIYVLVGIERNNLKSNEASVKYLLLGAFASAIMLYGMALIYGMTGNLNYTDIYTNMMPILKNHPLPPGDYTYLVLMIGVGMMLAGLFFKVAAVPFHMWTPDVYEGAPTPITAYMATGVKAAAFAAMLRFFIAMPGLWLINSDNLFMICCILAVLTMTIGNVTAIAQKNIKRMLAFSSIAHAGYLLIGIATLFAISIYYEGPDSTGAVKVISGNAGSSILFYLIAYTFTNLGAFGVIILLSREKEEGDTLDGFAGIGTSRPGLAAVMAICMLSLAGIPPLVGFTAKFQIFHSAVTNGVGNALLTVAIIGVLNSVVSAYFYLRVLVFMYMTPEKVPFKNDSELISGVSVANIVMAIAVVTLGLFPKVVIELASKTISSIQNF
jgi:NADH-quinone oxidoreductase subunit N